MKRIRFGSKDSAHSFNGCISAAFESVYGPVVRHVMKRDSAHLVTESTLPLHNPAALTRAQANIVPVLLLAQLTFVQRRLLALSTVLMWVPLLRLL